MSYQSRLNPNVLAIVEGERKWQDGRGGIKTRRVKIEKVNNAWLVRFLPVALGTSNLFFYRMAQHWHNKSPIVCPRLVSPDFGGNEDADCPVCDLSERLNAEQHEELSNFGWRLRANTTYVTYCLVYQIDPGRGELQELSLNEVLRPWEFNLYKSTWEELCDYFRRGKSAQRPLSVLDPKAGNDFWATKTTKGIRLDRQDPGPMFELNANFDKYLSTVMNAVPEPQIKLPSEQALAIFARKAEAAAYGDEEPARQHVPGRRGELDEGEDQDDREAAPAPRRSSARSNPRNQPESRISSVEEPEAAPEELGDGSYANEPRDEDAPPPRGTSVPQEEDQLQGVEVQARQARVSSGVRAPSPVAPARSGLRPASTGAAPVSRVVASRTAVPAPVSARRTVVAPAVQETVSEEEDPGVAEESVDPAGPVEEGLPEGTEPAMEEAPPAPSVRGTRTGSAAANEQAPLRARLAARFKAADAAR